MRPLGTWRKQTIAATFGCTTSTQCTPPKRQYSIGIVMRHRGPMPFTLNGITWGTHGHAPWVHVNGRPNLAARLTHECCALCARVHDKYRIAGAYRQLSIEVALQNLKTLQRCICTYCSTYRLRAVQPPRTRARSARCRNAEDASP